MKLKERFKKQLDTATPTLNRPFYQAEKCEQIAEQFAIEFADWVCKHHETDAIVFGILDTKELLKTFKKQKLS